MQDIDAVIGSLDTLRSDEDSWDDAVKLAASVGITLAIPCVVGRQANRANAISMSGSVKDYYRINVYVPFLDFILLQPK